MEAVQIAQILLVLSIIALAVALYLLSEASFSDKEDPDIKKRRLRGLFSIQVGLLFLFLLVVGILIIANILDQAVAITPQVGLRSWWIAFITRGGLSVLLGLIVYLALVGIYPLTYLAYRQLVSPSQKKRLAEDFKLLGFHTEEEAKREAEEQYEIAYSPKQYIWNILLIMLISALVLLGFIFPANITVDAVDKNVLWLIFYAYLGAYVFSIQELIRRFNTEDLRPQVYSSILMRTLVAMAVTFVGAQILVAAGAKLNTTEVVGQTAGPVAWAAILAFLIGIFPKSGIEWFQRLARSILSTPEEVNALPVRNIQGISTWHEARLVEMGIDDVQNLATVDIRRILLSTRFDIQEVINWIDQAILYTKVRDKYPRFKDLGISTFHEFRMRQQQSIKASQAAAAGDSIGDTKNLAIRLGLSVDQDLEYLADTTTYLNYSYISQYYRSVTDLARARAQASRNELRRYLEDFQADEQRVFTDLQVEYQARLDQDPNDVIALVNLGLVQFKLGNVEDAYNSLKKAESMDNNLPEVFTNLSVVCIILGKWEEARNYATHSIDLNPNNKYPYRDRGRASVELKEHDKAVQDFDQAIRLDDHYGEAYFSRGIVYNLIGEFEKAVYDFDLAYWLLVDRSDPKFWLEWGTAYLGLANQKEKSARGSGTSNCQNAIEKLTGSISRKETAEAYWKRGLVCFLMNCLEPAIRDYLKAVEIAERQNDSALYNIYLLLGETYWKAGRYTEACERFQTISKNAPSGSEPAIKAASYLTQSQCGGVTAPPSVPPTGPLAGAQPVVAAPMPAATPTTTLVEGVAPGQPAAPDQSSALIVKNLKELGVEVTWSDWLKIFAEAVLGEIQVSLSPKKIQELTDNTGVTLDQIRRASLMNIPGVNAQLSALLLKAEVISIRDLGQKSPEALLDGLEQANTDPRLVEQVPTLEQLRGWIEEANKLVSAPVEPEGDQSSAMENDGTIKTR